MKYNLDTDVIFKFIQGGDTFISKGTIVAYTESLNPYGQGIIYNPYAYQAPSMHTSASNPNSTGPGYIIITKFGTQTVRESDITDVMKKELFKEEITKIMTENT